MTGSVSRPLLGGPWPWPPSRSPRRAARTTPGRPCPSIRPSCTLRTARAATAPTAAATPRSRRRSPCATSCRIPVFLAEGADGRPHRAHDHGRERARCRPSARASACPRFSRSPATCSASAERPSAGPERPRLVSCGWGPPTRHYRDDEGFRPRSRGGVPARRQDRAARARPPPRARGRCAPSPREGERASRARASAPRPSSNFTVIGLRQAQGLHRARSAAPRCYTFPDRRRAARRPRTTAASSRASRRRRTGPDRGRASRRRSRKPAAGARAPARDAPAHRPRRPRAGGAPRRARRPSPRSAPPPSARPPATVARTPAAPAPRPRRLPGRCRSLPPPLRRAATRRRWSRAPTFDAFVEAPAAEASHGSRWWLWTTWSPSSSSGAASRHYCGFLRPKEEPAPMPRSLGELPVLTMHGPRIGCGCSRCWRSASRSRRIC